MASIREHVSRVQVFLHVTPGWRTGMDHDPGTLDSGRMAGMAGPGSPGDQMRDSGPEPEPGEVQTLAGPDQSERRQGGKGAPSGTWCL